MSTPFSLARTAMYSTVHGVVNLSPAMVRYTAFRRAEFDDRTEYTYTTRDGTEFRLSIDVFGVIAGTDYATKAAGEPREISPHPHVAVPSEYDVVPGYTRESDHADVRGFGRCSGFMYLPSDTGGPDKFTWSSHMAYTELSVFRDGAMSTERKVMFDHRSTPALRTPPRMLRDDEHIYDVIRRTLARSPPGTTKLLAVSDPAVYPSRRPDGRYFMDWELLEGRCMQTYVPGTTVVDRPDFTFERVVGRFSVTYRYSHGGRVVDELSVGCDGAVRVGAVRVGSIQFSRDPGKRLPLTAFLYRPREIDSRVVEHDDMYTWTTEHLRTRLAVSRGGKMLLWSDVYV